MRSRNLMMLESQQRSESAVHDPFENNPIRRSFLLVIGCSLVLFLPWLISDSAGESVMISIGWLALTGIVIGIPVLIISLIELAAASIRARIYPRIELLDLSPRVNHILLRHGVETIAEAERLSDAALLSFSNMDERSVREIRRQLTVWNYQQWQQDGFPARDAA